MLVLAGALALVDAGCHVVLAICRAAARADEHQAGRGLVRAVRRGATVSLAAAAVTLPAGPDDASARQDPCPNRDVRFEVAPAAAREALLCEIDQVRAARDVGRLRGDPQLDLAAARHATDMVERRYFGHVSPGGGDLADRGRRAGYALRRC